MAEPPSVGYGKPVDGTAFDTSGAGSYWDSPKLGGRAGTANDIATGYGQTSQGFYNRQGPQLDQSGTSNIGDDRANYAQDQDQRAQELSALYARATGQAGPSAAQNAAVMGAQNAAAGNTSIAHGMSGAGGALAARNAANQAAALQTGGANQAAQIGAQEQQQAAQQYMQASAADRGYALQNQGNEQGLSYGLDQEQLRQQAENDRMGLGYQQLGQDAEAAQLGADTTAYTSQLAGQGAMDTARANAKAQTRSQVISGVSTGVGSLLALGLLSDIRAKGEIQPQGSGPMQGNGFGRPPLSQVMNASRGGYGGMGNPGGFRPQVSTPMRPPMGQGPGPGMPMHPGMGMMRPPMGGPTPAPGGFQASTPVRPPMPAPGGGGFQASTPVRPPMGTPGQPPMGMSPPMMMSDAHAKADAMAQGVRAGLQAGMTAPRPGVSPHDMALLDTRVTNSPQRQAALAQMPHLQNLRQYPDMVSGSDQIPAGQIPGMPGVMSDERAKMVSGGLERSPPDMGQGMSLGRTLLSGPADPNRSYPQHEAYAFREEYMPAPSIMSDERTKDVKPKHMVEDSDRRNLLVNNEGGSREISYPGRTRRLERLTREDSNEQPTWTRPEATPGDYSFASDERLKRGGGHDMTEADHFLSHLHPYTYRYKDPSYEPTSQPNGGHYLGVMAQDVERAPVVGRQIVKDTPRGKMLEGGALMSALAAGVGRLHERVAQLEGGGKKAKEGSRGTSAMPKDEG